jgi:3-oxoacyl-[acyl-carrier-protein] synthase-1
MTPLAISASGLVTSVGFDAPATLAAMRAGIRNVKETNLWDPESGAYLAAGKVPLPQWWVGIGKVADLAAAAIRECLQAAEPIPPQDIPVLVGIAPRDRPFRQKDLETHLLPEIEHRLGFSLNPDSGVIPRDHVSVIVALQETARLIGSKRLPCVIVAAVDSLLDHDLKDYYLGKRRLLTPVSSNGFSLGEAGAAVLVTTAGDGRGGGELQIRGMGLTRENATIESEAALRGDGLVAAIREAFRDGQMGYDDLHYRISDLNGEHYKFKEMVLAMMRLATKPKPKLFDLWHPIEYIGDVGAAIGPLLLAVALHAGQKGYGVGPTALCTLGNDNGERGALAVTYAAPG